MEPLTLIRHEAKRDGCRAVQVVAYRDEDGRLLLAEIGTGYSRDRAGRLEEARLALSPEEVAGLRDLLAELEEDS